MLRTALQPRWLALLALALAAATAFAGLGSWQLERSRTEPREEGAASRPPVSLVETVAPQQPFSADVVDRVVEFTGELDDSRTLLVTGRLSGGESGTWVLTPLVVPTDDGEATLPVVRGWMPAGGDVPPAPEGQVTVRGRMEPSEAPTGRTDGDTVTAVSSADLVNRWEPPLWTGFLLSETALGEGLRAVRVEPSDDGGFALQNLSYALQWWVFAGFAVFLWWRVVRDDHLRASQPVQAGDGEPADVGDDGSRPGAGDRAHDPDRTRRGAAR